MRHTLRAAFSLIELSIVLAVIGLLVGGIIGGQAMMDGARLNGISKDLAAYDIAVQNFRTRFKGWPGDIMNATNYWGAASGGCPTGAGTGTQTCNGNGDAMQGGSAGTANEPFRAWQHLANAGLISGNFTGVAGGGGIYEHVVGTNAPLGRFDKSGYGFNWYGAGFSGLGDIGGNLLFFGGQSSTTLPSAAMLSATDTASIDGKLDDGLPGMGRVQQYNATTRPNCATTDVASTAKYDVRTNIRRACPVIFKLSNQG